MPGAVSGLFGGGSSGRGGLPQSIAFNSPGFGGSVVTHPGGISGGIQRTGSLAQRQFDERSVRILGDLDTLRGTLTPGFSALRRARAAEVDNARNRAVGNLRDNLARRRVEGSSFAQNAFIRAERDFAEEAAAQQAQSFLEETAANQALLQQEHATIAAGIQRELQELQIATGFVNQATSIINRNLQFEEQLAAENAAGQGALLGSIARLGLAAFSAGGPFGRGGAFGDSFGNEAAINQTFSGSSGMGSFGSTIPAFR